MTLRFTFTSEKLHWKYTRTLIIAQWNNPEVMAGIRLYWLTTIYDKGRTMATENWDAQHTENRVVNS